jgi:hypothetical protein
MVTPAVSIVRSALEQSMISNLPYCAYPDTYFLIHPPVALWRSQRCNYVIPEQALFGYLSVRGAEPPGSPCSGCSLDRAVNKKLFGNPYTRVNTIS